MHPPPSNTPWHVLVPCAGKGSRAQTLLPKQYQPLAGVPLLVHSLLAFRALPGMGQGLVVVASDDQQIDQVWAQWPQTGFRHAPVGGATRAASVAAGLQALRLAGAADTDWVLVHDAARCLLTAQDVHALLQHCQGDAVGGLLAVPLPDTLKSERDGRAMATVPRAHKWLAQTPQMFRLGLLQHALAKVADTGFAGITDEASAIERLGLQPLLVQGSAHNFKVTYPADFALAQAVLAARAETHTHKDLP
ncbi:MAG: 2-C-methyl-D-erythritol 4-phosphate cytidylyltransferase [Betaproteobacteria bacterium]|nr:2-C-methyl-D-erythritol 4-phosphate cytidylyltransferase [Betaproteobacteria bacterium]NBY05496.1 2-C-methyl-D-erythritol 4-phosphate cytidylyltransferase [Betaproteobacteria bacterium]